MTDDKKILVTGGAGYIGSHVVKLLCERGYEVIVFDNFSLGLKENVDDRAEVIKGDIRNDDDLAKAFSNNISVVIHLAAWKAAGESMLDPAKYATNNISGSINLLNAMLKYEVTDFVFSSSAAVYGTPEYLPVDERHPVNPDNYYGYTKLAIEENVRWFSKLKGLRHALLRYFNATGYDLTGVIKGKEKDPANLLPVVMEVAAGEREKLHVYGNDYETPDGTCIRDYIHVDDLASAHLMAMEYIAENNDNLTVNLGAGKGHSVLDVVASLEKVSGKPVPCEIVGRREGDPRELVADYSLAEKLLGWRPESSDLHTIIKSMCEVYL